MNRLCPTFARGQYSASSSSSPSQPNFRGAESNPPPPLHCYHYYTTTTPRRPPADRYPFPERANKQVCSRVALAHRLFFRSKREGERESTYQEVRGSVARNRSRRVITWKNFVLRFFIIFFF